VKERGKANVTGVPEAASPRTLHPSPKRHADPNRTDVHTVSLDPARQGQEGTGHDDSVPGVTIGDIPAAWARRLAILTSAIARGSNREPVVTRKPRLAVKANRPTYYVCGACLGQRHEDCAGIYEPGTCSCACKQVAEDSARRAHEQARGRPAPRRPKTRL
jgi:hypothetical protein